MDPERFFALYSEIVNQISFYYSFVEMVTLLISGLPFTSKVEIIKENNTTEVCETMADFPIVIQRAAGSVWNDGG